MPKVSTNDIDLKDIALHAFNQQTFRQKDGEVAYHDMDVHRAYQAWEAYWANRHPELAKNLFECISVCVSNNRSGFAELYEALSHASKAASHNQSKPKL